MKTFRNAEGALAVDGRAQSYMSEVQFDCRCENGPSVFSRHIKDVGTLFACATVCESAIGTLLKLWQSSCSFQPLNRLLLTKQQRQIDREREIFWMWMISFLFYVPIPIHNDCYCYYSNSSEKTSSSRAHGKSLIYSFLSLSLAHSVAARTNSANTHTHTSYLRQNTKSELNFKLLSILECEVWRGLARRARELTLNGGMGESE